MRVPLTTQLLRLVGMLDPVNRFNYTSWMAVVSRTDRPKSVCNCCVIEVFGGVSALSLDFLFSDIIGVFVIRLSQISSFFTSWRFIIIQF